MTDPLVRRNCISLKEKPYLSPRNFTSMRTSLLPLCVIIVFLAVFTGCTRNPSDRLSDGPWLGTIVYDSVDQVPFNFEVSHDSAGQPFITVINAGEHIKVTEVSLTGDTLEWRMPVFQSVIRAGFRSKGLVGLYYPKGVGKAAPNRFVAVSGQTLRFPHMNQKPQADITGRWKIVENPSTPDELVMIGEFVQDGPRLTGTILSPYGDYRYLEGIVSGRMMSLSGFDGSHAIVLSAHIAPDGSLVEGRFAGSPRWKSVWVAERNDTIKLPEQNVLVRLRPGALKPAFSLDDTDGNKVSLSDERFSGKVVVMMASGTWCPNCMDEARMFAGLYKQYRGQGLEVVSLFFETGDFDESSARIRRFASHTGADYTLLWAGERSGARRDSLFNMVEGKMAFPTTLYIDRKGNPRFVETGFSGPGTGKHYDETLADVKSKIELLLNEK